MPSELNVRIPIASHSRHGGPQFEIEIYMCQIFFNIKKRILSEIQDLKYYKTSFNSLFRKSLSYIVEINADQNSDPNCIEATSDAADEGANHACFE